MTDTDITRAAIVTGSSRGIGAAIARALAERGMNVALNCSSERSLPETEQLARELANEYGVDTIAVVANVASAEEAQRLAEGAQTAFGRIDVLVNNAGITRDGLAARMSTEDFDAVIDVNLKGSFHCAKAVMRTMMKQRYGRIINMSSVSGVYGNAGQVNYAASKAGIIGMTKTLAKELARKNITVNAIAPGFIDTAMTAALSDEQRQAAAARIGMGRLGAPKDIAALAGFLASEQAGYITGQTICVDGGLTL